MRIKVGRSSALSGRIALPGDKSISHRAALLGALAEGESRFENFLVAGVTQVMLDALRCLGVCWRLDAQTLTLSSPGLDKLAVPQESLYCGHSGTTLRLLTGALAAANLDVVLEGSERLRQRPMGRIVTPLLRMGANLVSDQGHAPLRLSHHSRPLKGLRHETPVASAQVKSAILLAGLRADAPTVVIEPGPSRDHTERMLSAMGISIVQSRMDDGRPEIRLMPATRGGLSPLQMCIPGDFSAAAFLISAAALLPDSEVFLPGVGLNWTRSGMLSALKDMGARIRIENPRIESGEDVGNLKVSYALLHGGQIDGDLVVRMIDEFPAFAVAAAFAEGRTVVGGAAELRVKESDRIHGICQALGALGVKIEETADGFILQGCPEDLAGGVTLNPNRDHRMAMAFILAGLRCKAPIIIEEAQIINQSFPGFIQALQSLGADRIEVLDD